MLVFYLRKTTEVDNPSKTLLFGFFGWEKLHTRSRQLKFKKENKPSSALINNKLH